MGRNSGYAIASLVFGLFALVIGWIPVIGWLIAILAISFGFTARNKIRQDPTLEGKELALAGLIMGFIPVIVSIILVPIGALAYFGVMSPDKFLPEKCMMPSGFACLDFKQVGTAGMIDAGALVVIQNSMGQDITVTSLELSDSTKKCSATISPQGTEYSAQNSPVLPNGGKSTYTFTCGKTLKGDKMMGALTMNYISKTTNVANTAKGELVIGIR